MAGSSRQNRLALVVALIAVLTIGTAAFLCARTSSLSTEDAAFFSSALGSSTEPIVVILQSKSFSVERGEVHPLSSESLSEKEKAAALALAYAVSLTTETPILSLEGTNLELLGSALDRLAAATTRLAALQDSADAKARVSGALYPQEYLRALVALETKRRSFIASGKESALYEYERQLEETIEKGEESLQRFQEAYQEAMQPTYAQGAAVGGKLTEARTLEVLRQIAQGYKKIKDNAKERMQCVRGTVAACPTLAPLAITPPAASSPREERLRATLAILDQALPANPFRTIVGLETSACIPEAETTYILPPPTRLGTFGTYSYAGDFLVRTIGEPSGPMLAWFKEQGVRYLPYNPLIFYTCPDLGGDLARTKSVLRIGHMLGLIDTTKDPILYEHKVLTALNQAQAQAHSSDKNLLHGLYREYRDRSAGFEDVVYDIAHGLESTLSMHERALPNETSEAFLFGTHSGYYSLFLAYNPTAGSSLPSPYVPDEARTFWSTFTRVSTLEAVDTKQLIHDLGVFADAHK